MKSIAASSTSEILRNPTGFMPWIVCFSAALFFFFIFIQVNLFNAIGPSLMKEFGLSAAKVGQLSAHYFYATMIFVFPAGLLLDRFSTRTVILWSMGTSVICTYLFSITHSVFMSELFRFAMGIGGSFCLISCIRLASRWFPPRRLALVIGLIITFAMFGGMLAQTPMTLLTDSIGWRNSLALDAALGVVMLAVIAFFVKDQPLDATINIPNYFLWRDFKKSLGEALSNSQNWLGGIYTSLMNLPLMLIGAVWGSLYLVQAHHFSRTEASFITSMIFVGTIIGSPVVGWFSDRLGLRRLPMLLGALASLATILAIMFLPTTSMATMMILFLSLGFFTSTQIISYPLIAESNSKKLTGTAEGIASTLIMAGGTTQPLFGLLLGLHWNHAMINNIPVYSANDYFIAMMMIPCAFIIGFIAAFFIRETHCKPLD